MTQERSMAQFRENNFYPSIDLLQENLGRHKDAIEIYRYLKTHNIPLRALLSRPERGGGALSDLGILRHMLAGNIVIHPFNADQLGPNSYDVTVGHFYYHWKETDRNRSFRTPARPVSSTLITKTRVDSLFERQEVAPVDFSEHPTLPLYNPFDSEHVQHFWQLREAVRYEQFKEERNMLLEGIDKEDEIILLYPHEMILGHTNEFIGGLNIVIPEISGKSSSGRNMTEMCSDANMGNIGFLNRYTLEIANKSGYAIPLVVEKVAYASFIFREAQVPGQSYKGQYAKSIDIDEVAKAWVPEMMLPRMKRIEGR